MILDKEMQVPDIIFISGLNKSGKKTQSIKIKNKYDYEIINIENILQLEVEKQGEVFYFIILYG